MTLSLLAIDELLSLRARQASELPWLPLKVENQLAARAKARTWMSEHRASLRHTALDWLRNPSLNPRMLASLGAGLGVAFLALLAGQQPGAAAVVSQFGVWPLALLAGGISALAVSWPTLRQYYM